MPLPPRGLAFARTAIAMAAKSYDPAGYAAARWGERDPATLALKAAVPAANSSDWSELADANQAAVEFLDMVRPATILGKLEALRRVPVNVPYCAVAESATATWVGEGQPIALSRAAFARERMKSLKLSALLAISNDLLESQTLESELLILRDLAQAIIKLSDSTFIDPNNAGDPGVSPAAVTYDAEIVTATASLKADIEEAIARFEGDLSTASWVLHPKLAVSIGLRSGASGLAVDLGARGGILAGLPAITSTAVPISSSGSSIALVDGAGIVVVDQGIVTRRSQSALIEMSDAPTGESFGPTAASQEAVSMFQTDSTAILAIRHLNWAVARQGAVVLIDGADYTE